MPTGFSGSAPAAYINTVNNELSSAATAHKANPLPNLSPAAVSFPPLPVIRNESTPHEPNTARSGGNSSGTGDSSNIVIDDNEYHALLTRIDRIDDDMGRKLHEIATSIESLCRSDFMLPRTVEKSGIITLGLKNALSGYRTLTEETLIEMRKFINDVLAIG